MGNLHGGYLCTLYCISALHDKMIIRTRCAKSTVNVYRYVVSLIIFAARCYASAAYIVMRCLSVCPSVRLSRSCVVSKRINISSEFFHRLIATPFWFFRAKRHSNIPTGTILTGAGEVDRNRDSEPLSGLTACANAATG